MSGFFFEAEPDHGEIHKYDGGTRTTHRLPYGHTCGEPVFVPGAGSRAEDDGYLVTFAHDRAAGTSYLLVLDAIAMTVRAEVHLPVRVPGGFHGTGSLGPGTGRFEPERCQRDQCVRTLASQLNEHNPSRGLGESPDRR